MNIVYMGTPEFAVHPLETLFNSGFNIPLVVSQEDKPKGRGKKLLPTPVKKKAQELNLEIYQPKKINCEECIQRINEINPDFIVVAAYGQILKSEILSIPRYGCINIHASLLPRYRGAAPINWAIINGEDETGITIMKMEEGLDSGDILLKKSIPITEADDSITIHDKLSKLGGELIVEGLMGIVDESIVAVKQDHSKSTYAPMLDKKLGKINWNKSGKDIRNLVRGLKPWPFAYTFYNDLNIKIHEVSIIDKYKDGENGEIVKVSNEGVFVNCSDSTIVIEELQFPGKKKLKVEEYIRGNTIEEGTILK